VAAVGGDDTVERLLDCGALRHYTALLDGDFDDCVQTEVVQGLSTLPLQCRHYVINQPGCLDG